MSDLTDKIVSIIAGSMLLAFLSGILLHFTGCNATERPKGSEIPKRANVFFNILLMFSWLASAGAWIWHIVLAKSWLSAIITFFLLVGSNMVGWTLGKKWYENPK